MATYVLVHGGGHGGWCYDKVARRLRYKGHEVRTPTLTGLGERAHLLRPDVDLAMHIRDVVAVLHYDDLRDVILVGHSYGGMVITGVADRAADHVGTLVYLDAANPVNGQSLVDVAGPIIEATRPMGEVVDGVGLAPLPSPEAGMFYGVTDVDDLAWMADRLTGHPWKCFAQPLTLTNEAALWAIPQYHIVCTSTLATRDPKLMAKARADGRLWDIDTGHDLMITEPEAVTAALLDVAASAGEQLMSDYETLLVTKDDGVAWVSLNRPQVRNAFNLQMQAELRDLWRGFRYDDDVRCVVLSGEGDAFCTGIDRTEAMSDEARETDFFSAYPTPWMYDDPGGDVGPKSNDLWKPVVAAVHGLACGGAFYMLGETEFIIAAEDAVFFDPHVTYGMTAAFEPMQMLTKMPFPEIMRMSLLGVHERMSAERAREIGLVTEVVPRAELHDRAAWAARVIADSPPLAIQGTMRALWTALEVSRSQGIALANLFTRIGSDPAAFEAGQQRFASGERPKWRLR